MRTYKEYLIPETIDYEEIKYLVSIGSKVLVRVKHPNLGNTIVELFPDNKIGVNHNICPLSISDMYLIKRNTMYIYFCPFYIGNYV